LLRPTAVSQAPLQVSLLWLLVALINHKKLNL
jgi:hypothetical protein